VANVEQHYDQVLSDVYSWMYGGYDAALARYTEFFSSRGVTPTLSGRAVDLGAGCGFQSIPLARLGFAVTAIDIDRKLLDELSEHAGDAEIAIERGDLLDFERHVHGPIELAVCMVDTLVHLESKALVTDLFAKVYRALEPGGRFVITYRDLSRDALDLDRFIPVRADHERILTCFLEYAETTVRVHDLLHQRENGIWKLTASSYPKLRLAPDWVVEQLTALGFTVQRDAGLAGMVRIRAAAR